MLRAASRPSGALHHGPPEEHRAEVHGTARTNPAHPVLYYALIGAVAFLTLVDLFAAQAILPVLTKAYGVTPAAMGIAVNASTLGMAVAGLGVALFSRRLDRRRGIVISLLLLAIPTSALAIAPSLAVFTLLRVLQGLCMATAFTLTLAHLGETSSGRDSAGAFAAYITGNVASNLVGRLVAAALADHLGLSATFLAFAGLNLTGAALALAAVPREPAGPSAESMVSPFAALGQHLRNTRLLAGFAVGFCILFAFIGTFTYVNFVLVKPPLSLGMMALGFVYVVFLPSIVTTPLAGLTASRWGTRRAFLCGIALALVGLPLTLWPALPPVLCGLALVGVGTFFAQAVATGFVGRAATADRGAASGLYLASYFGGGLVGSAVLGQLFDAAGWGACVAGIAAALCVAFALGFALVLPAAWATPTATATGTPTSSGLATLHPGSPS